MYEVDFIYNGNNTIIQCKENEKMENICKRFSTKIDKNIENLYFLYSSNNLNNQLLFSQCANKEDLNRKKMNILVFSNDDKNENKSVIKSEEVICPICNEVSLIKIKDYKIKLYGCKNKHINDQILLDEYEDTQKINLSKIICGKCLENRSNTFKNTFYTCYVCKINLCPLCKKEHEKDHNVYDYEQKKYKCEIHNDSYNSFCKTCNKNICMMCEGDHNNHNIIYFGKIISNINYINEKKDELRKLINTFNNSLENIRNIIKKVMENMEKYYSITDNIITNIINNINNKNRNYEILSNINIIDNNDIIKDLENIINDEDIYSKFNNILNMYNKMTSKNDDEIKLIYNPNNENKIKIFGKNFVKNNKDNCKIIINGKENELQEYVPNNNKDFIEIKLKGINNIIDISYMFSGCSSLSNLSDFSNWNTSNITKMKRVFYDCSSLTQLPDISKWDTSNVTTMHGMFHGCSSLLSLPDISNWDTSSVNDMSCLFYGCSSLAHLPNISKWDITKVEENDCMFDGCRKLSNIPQKFLN